MRQPRAISRMNPEETSMRRLEVGSLIAGGIALLAGSDFSEMNFARNLSIKRNERLVLSSSKVHQRDRCDHPTLCPRAYFFSPKPGEPCKRQEHAFHPKDSKKLLCRRLKTHERSQDLISNIKTQTFTAV